MPQIKKSEPQISLFDLQDDENNYPEDMPEITQEEVKTPEPKKGNDMYMRYLAIKQKYDDCIVLYRLGDFYEMFNSDAITAAEILNLTLTSRDVGLDERIPMAGLPYHAVDPYMQKLIESGYKVAICEPLGDTYSERVINPAETPVQEIDEETGEIIHEDNDTELYTALSFDKEDMLYLYDLLDGDMDIE
jgi:DNA mismatch repair ATPase MutS